MVNEQKVAELYNLAWPADRLGEAIQYLARVAGLLAYPTGKTIVESTTPPSSLDRLNSWIEWNADQLGLEAEPITATYAEVEQFLKQAAPALLLCPNSVGANSLAPKNLAKGTLTNHSQLNRGSSSDGGLAHSPRFLLLVRAGYRHLTLFGPDRAQHRVSKNLVRQILCASIEQRQQPWIDTLLQNVQIPQVRRQSTRQALLRELAGDTVIQQAWYLRLTPASDLRQQLTISRLPRVLLRLLLCNLGLLLLQLLAWVVVNQLTANSTTANSADGQIWQWAWALLLLTTVPLIFWGNYAQNELAVGLGQIFKQRLLFGALRLNREEVRSQGAGQFLGRVLDAELLEQLGLNGGFTILFALIQLVAAAVILTLGETGWLHTNLLLFWLGVTLLLCWRYWQKRRIWIEAYRNMTNDLVERMVGHRTRLVQEERHHWHTMEDQLLDRYLVLSKKADNSELLLKTLVARGWMLVGILGLAYAWVWNPGSPTPLLLSLGGILLALQSLNNLMSGIQSIIGGLLAWQHVGPLFQAATHARDQPTQEPRLLPEFESLEKATQPLTAQNRQAFLMVRDLHFRYPGRSQPILQGCNLQIQQGDRLLLEGPSGSGKSTFAALLAGLQQPDSGLLLLWGFDRKTLGNRWQQRVVAAPQFHENHIFTGTLAFNLLLGRHWPPRAADLVDAELICRELGLGELLDRMPAGLQQVVGESGWQLSHGERSRLFMARTLLQPADLMILDENFAALDPENLQRALQCVLRRAPTLLVIAHP